MSMAAQGCIAAAIGIAFIVFGFMYSKRKYANRDRDMRRMDEFLNYDKRMETYMEEERARAARKAAKKGVVPTETVETETGATPGSIVDEDNAKSLQRLWVDSSKKEKKNKNEDYYSEENVRARVEARQAAKEANKEAKKAASKNGGSKKQGKKKQ